MVDEQPVWVLERLPTLATAWDEAKAAVNERAAQEAERQAQAGR